MKYILLIIIALFFSSCLTDAKLARLCSDRFPNRITEDSTRVDSVRATSVTTPLPPISHTVNCPASEVSNTIEVIVPGGIATTDSIWVYQTQYRTLYDSATIFTLKDSVWAAAQKAVKDAATIEAHKKELTEKAQKMRRLWIGITALLLLMGAYIGWQLTRRFSKNLSFLSRLLRG